MFDFVNTRDTPLMTIKRLAPPLTPFRDMQYNPAERAVLLTSMAEGGSYELYVIPKEANAESMPCVYQVRAMILSWHATSRRHF